MAEAIGPKIAVAIPWKNLTGISQIGELTKRYNNGAIRKIKPEIKRSFLRPILSDIKPIGKLNKIPAKGEKAEIKPMIISEPPSAWIYKGSTGLLEIVVEKMAKKPIKDK